MHNCNHIEEDCDEEAEAIESICSNLLIQVSQHKTADIKLKNSSQTRAIQE